MNTAHKTMDAAQRAPRSQPKQLAAPPAPHLRDSRKTVTPHCPAPSNHSQSLAQGTAAGSAHKPNSLAAGASDAHSFIPESCTASSCAAVSGAVKQASPNSSPASTSTSTATCTATAYAGTAAGGTEQVSAKRRPSSSLCALTLPSPDGPTATPLQPDPSSAAQQPASAHTPAPVPSFILYPPPQQAATPVIATGPPPLQPTPQLAAPGISAPRVRGACGRLSGIYLYPLKSCAPQQVGLWGCTFARCMRCVLESGKGRKPT